uniref:adenylate kinase 8-like n=1 Tax=Styela clava TaxID=7725 RepID=UPI00193A1BB4|nr:adenylate kinase 8-like [Styela clava]
MDTSKKPLRIPPEFGVYAEEHEIFDMYKRLLSQVIVEKPDDPIQFMIDWLKRDSSDTTKIVVVGPPWSGKTCISTTLSKQINSVLVTEQEILSDELSEHSKKANALLAEKKPVPDTLWVQMIRDRVKRKDCLRRGFILEGFPRNRSQAYALQSYGIMPTHAIILDAPDVVLMERQGGKRVDPITGDVYHTTFDWPQDVNIQARLIEPDKMSETDTKERLDEYNRNADGISNTYAKVCKKLNADQPKADVLAQAISFINTRQRSEAAHTPRIVLIGPTGSGKSVVAAQLAQKYNIVDVSCGLLIKQQVADETRLGEAVRQYVEEDQKPPNNLVSKILSDRLTQLDATTRGWVLHGYPLTREQAENLTDSGLKPNRVYFLDIPDDVIVERLCYRLTDPISGERYHTLFNPPRTADVKARCVQNPKDKEETVRSRLEDYHVYSEDLTEYYRDDGSVRINADQDPHTVFEFVDSILVNPLPRKLGKD